MSKYIDSPAKSQVNNFTQSIPGLYQVPNYIDTYQHNWLVDTIDHSRWLTDLKRRVQHYGYKYDYRARAIDRSMALPTPPEWVLRLAAKLHNDGHMPFTADQVIVNEYQIGQGIGAHVDCEPCFGDVICSISLRSPVVMDFRHRVTKQHIPILLEPCSLLVMSGESRHHWTHGIAARQTDEWEGQVLNRARRISITLRTVVLDS